jgi:hypothetical protein
LPQFWAVMPAVKATTRIRSRSLMYGWFGNRDERRWRGLHVRMLSFRVV